MKRVLVPVDFSEASMNALNFGVELANLLKADLRVMHVITGKNYAPSFATHNTEMRIDGLVDTWMLKIKEDYQPLYKVHNGVFDFKIREGNVTREITNQAKYDDTSLIVLGSHGISGFEDRWIGSNAYRVVSNATCPVMLVRKDVEWKPFKRIVLPLEIKKESRLKVPVVTGVAKLFGAKLYLVGLKETNLKSMINSIRSVIRQVDRFIKSNTQLETEIFILSGGNLPRKLIEYGESVQADLVTIQIHHETNLFNDLVKPFANDLINIATIPVLVVPTKY